MYATTKLVSCEEITSTGKPEAQALYANTNDTAAQFDVTGADSNQPLAELRFAIVDTDEQIADCSEEIAPVASQEGLQQAPAIVVALESHAEAN